MSHRLGHQRRTLPLALSLIVVLLGAALLGPALITADPLRPELSVILAPPSMDRLLGADELGRSVLARLMAGARLSLGLSVTAALATAALGSLVGLFAAHGRGLGRRSLLGLMDLVFACPGLLFVMLLAGLFDGGPWTVLAGLVLTRWPAFARLCFPLGCRALAAPDAEASRLLGFGSAYMIRRHAWPAVRRPVASLAALQLGTTILTVSSLGFLGIGLRPPEPEWGAMVADALPYLRDAPHVLLAPACAIFLATWAATLVGDGLAQREEAGAAILLDKVA